MDETWKQYAKIQKVTYCMIYLYAIPRLGKSTETECRAGERGKEGVTS